MGRRTSLGCIYRRSSDFYTSIHICYPLFISCLADLLAYFKLQRLMNIGLQKVFNMHLHGNRSSNLYNAVLPHIVQIEIQILEDQSGYVSSSNGYEIKSEETNNKM